MILQEGNSEMINDERTNPEPRLQPTNAKKQRAPEE